MKQLRNLFAGHGVLLLATALPADVAQTWPTQTVRIVVSFTPGTQGDALAQLTQPALQSAWGQTVVVDNKPGAGGNVAAGELALAKDDQILLVGPDMVLTINPHLYKKLSVDLRASLQPAPSKSPAAMVGKEFAKWGVVAQQADCSWTEVPTPFARDERACAT